MRRSSRRCCQRRARIRAPAALDLGCGRGEWLELLGEYGFTARGIDLDDDMLAACRERGLQVETMDALAALRACADGSLALVSAFHLVEHIDYALVRELTTEALRALQPGGLLIMETPNPENLVVGASSFYMDPSHLRPIPPNLLAFTAEHAGYLRHKVVRLQEEPGLHTDPHLALINVLEGPSPDYSVVAQKQAAAAVLAGFDAAFSADYGLALAPLAVRYEEQHQLRQQRLETQLAHFKTMLAHQARNLDDIHALAERQALALDQADHRLGLLEQRLQAAEQRADDMGQRVIALLSSTSWRVTAPMRMVMALAYRLRSSAKHRLRAAVQRCGQAVLRRPLLKRLARPVLRWMPGLRSRLYLVVLQANTPLTDADAPGQLSPRAARVYHELKKLQDTRNS
jgi:SAM-dependent methyltransferase